MNHLHINIEGLPRSGKIHPLLKVFEILKPDFKSAWCYQQSLISAFRGGSRLVGSVQRARETLYCGTDAGWMRCEWKRRMLKKEQLASSGVAVPLKREGDAARWQWFVFILVRIAPAFQESLYCSPLGLQMNHTHTLSHTLSHKHALRPLNGYLVSGRCYFVNERFELYVIAWGGGGINN